MFVFGAYTLQRDRRLYYQPRVFDADGWQPGRTVTMAPYGGDQALLAFGAGARRSVGETFAWQQLNVVLSAVTRRWDLRSHDAEPLKGSARGLRYIYPTIGSTNSPAASPD